MRSADLSSSALICLLAICVLIPTVGLANWSTDPSVNNLVYTGGASAPWYYRDNITTDGHVETPATDADFALVVTGLSERRACCNTLYGSCTDTLEEDCVGRNKQWFSMFTCAEMTCPSQH